MTAAAHAIAEAHAAADAERSTFIAGDVRVERVPGRVGPSGKRFGTLVHAVLASAPSLTSDRDALIAIAHAHGRLLGATSAEIDAAATRVEAALAHPLLVRAANAEHRREVPVTARDDDGALLEGVIDLCFRDGNTWVIVDYKTDAAPSSVSAYALQLQAYGRAIRAATGRETQLVLLGV